MSLDKELSRIRTANYHSSRSLDLSHLRLTSLNPEICQLKNLRNLNLMGNQLSKLPAEFCHLANLRSLNLFDNNLSSLPSEIVELSKLEQLVVTKNTLSSLPGEIGKLTDLQNLYLSSNLLSSLPAELGKLTNLNNLVVYNNNLTSLPPEIGKLTNLKNLDISINKLSSLPNEIGNLTKLRNLNVSNNKLSSLPPEIGMLINLQTLCVYINQLKSLPVEIGKLVNLKTLSLYKNKLSSLPPEIGQLTNLQDLILLKNKLPSLPPEFGKLSNLYALDLDDNQLSSLPSEISKLKNIRILYLKNNVQLNIPPEILVHDGNYATPSTIIDYYFRTKVDDARPLNEAKIILVGQGAVGKTSLVNRLIFGKHNADEDKTEGIDIHQWEIFSSGKKIDLNIWDFGGQEIMHATHQFFLTKRSLYILVLDSRYDRSFNRVDYWLKMIESFGGDSPVLIVCNKSDQQPMDLNWRGLKEKFPNIKGFVKEVSCKDNIGIAKVKKLIKKEIPNLPHVGDKLPAKWFLVKDKLSKMKDAGDLDYMAIEKYREICFENGIEVESDQDSLVNFLNDLGTMLHYGKHTILSDLNILNPEWVTNGVYSIINNIKLLRNRDGILKIKSLTKILDHAKYPPHAHLFILKMMKKFEICFEFEGSGGEKYLIPDLLSEQELYTGEWEDSLRFEFHYDVLPGSIITRFIVRMNAFIMQNTYWKNGVVLRSEDKKNKALIVSDEDEGIISISVSGPEGSRYQLLSLIRTEFHAIHSSLQRIEIDERIPLPDNPHITVSYDHLRLLRSKGISDYIPEGSEKAYSVRLLLEGIEPAPSNQFDVFLCHNSEDKKDVKKMDIMLRKKGLKPWLDERDIRPGSSWQRALEKQIKNIKSAAVFVGKNGIGPWHREEIEAFLIEFNKRNCPVIPVILSNCNSVPELPMFLRNRHWVDFRKKDPDPLDQLIWAITGEKPSR